MNQEVVSLIESKGYEILKCVGKGGYAVCYTVHSCQYKQTFVCKVLDIAAVETEKRQSMIQSYFTEVEALGKLTHPNVVALYDHFHQGNYFCLVLEYCPGGSLSDKIKLHHGLDESDLMIYTKEIARGLDFIHKHYIAHHDIKPGNILLDAFGRAKIADFGLSRGYEEPSSEHFKGTIAFMPPEVLLKRQYDPFKADIWSFGATIYSLAKGELPFQGSTLSEVKDSICMGQIPFITNIPPLICDIIRHTIRVNPDERYSMQMICSLIDASAREKPVQLQSIRRGSIAISRPKCMSPIAVMAFKTIVKKPKCATPCQVINSFTAPHVKPRIPFVPV